MMRSILFVCCVLLTVPAEAQRVFRASSIDIEQNGRLDVLESRFSSIENSIERLTSMIQNQTVETPDPEEVKITTTTAPTSPPPSVQVTSRVIPGSIVVSSPVTSSQPYISSRTISQGSTASGSYDGTSQWTYPGDIRSHLASGNHGVMNTAGMTKDQMEALHDSLHNASRSGGYSPIPNTSAFRTVTRSVQQSSPCPGGVCPTGVQPVRRGIFGWRR